MTNSDVAFRKVQQFVGKDAVLAREMVHAFIMKDMVKLRDCQIWAAERLIELGGVIDVGKQNRTSPVGKMLRDAEIFLQLDSSEMRSGFNLYEGPRMDEFLDFLNDYPNYGKSAKDKRDKNVSIEQDLLLDHLEKYGCVRANQVTNKIPPQVYKSLAERAAAGQLDVIYVPRGALVKTKHNGEAVTVEYYVD